MNQRYSDSKSAEQFLLQLSKDSINPRGSGFKNGQSLSYSFDSNDDSHILQFLNNKNNQQSTKVFIEKNQVQNNIQNQQKKRQRKNIFGAQKQIIPHQQIKITNPNPINQPQLINNNNNIFNIRLPSTNISINPTSNLSYPINLPNTVNTGPNIKHHYPIFNKSPRHQQMHKNQKQIFQKSNPLLNQVKLTTETNININKQNQINQNSKLIVNNAQIIQIQNPTLNFGQMKQIKQKKQKKARQSINETSLIIQDRFSQIYPFNRNSLAQRQSKQIAQSFLNQKIFENLENLDRESKNIKMSYLDVRMSKQLQQRPISGLASDISNKGSFTRIFSKLPDIQFKQPDAQVQCIQLFKECSRLNSVSINISNPNFSIYTIKHKQMLRCLVFELILSGQMLENMSIEIFEKQKKQKRLVNDFVGEVYLQGQWYKMDKIKNLHLIIPKNSFQKRPQISNQQIKLILNKLLETLKIILQFIQNFNLDQILNQLKSKYIQLRTDIHDIFCNLKKISEDLFVKATNFYIPKHYYEFYDYLRGNNNDLLEGSSLQRRGKIQNRMMKLGKLEYWRQNHDLLCCSVIGQQIKMKLEKQLKQLRDKNRSTNQKII